MSHQPVYSYEQALDKTFKPKARVGGPFQALVALGLVCSLAGKFPIVGGLSYLEKVPSYECLQISSLSGEKKWFKCSQQQICADKISRDKYRPITTDPEYFDNWVDKLDLLCQSQAKIGFIGSSFFLGIISAIVILPYLADIYGRTHQIIGAIALQTIAQGVLIWTHNLSHAYFCLFLIGVTFPAKNIIWYNYALELTSDAWRQTLVSCICIFENSIILWLSMYYQFISRNYLYIQLFGFGLVVFMLLVTMVCFMESPKFLYNKKRYDEARESLRTVAYYNGINDYDTNFMFDKEVGSPDAEEDAVAAITDSETTHDQSLEEQEMDKNYVRNMVVMTIFWSAASFSTFLLNFMNKYLEGSIFQNNYAEGFAGVISVAVGSQVYAIFGKRIAFQISFGLALAGGIVIYLLESKHLNIPFFILNTFPGNPMAQHHQAMQFLIPKITFFAKFGTALSLLFTNQASFSDQTLFPVQTRASAIGICQFIARGVTVLAPQVCELPSPAPIQYFCAIAFLALATSFTLAHEKTEFIEDSARTLSKQKQKSV